MGNVYADFALTVTTHISFNMTIVLTFVITILKLKHDFEV